MRATDHALSFGGWQQSITSRSSLVTIGLIRHVNNAELSRQGGRPTLNIWFFLRVFLLLSACSLVLELVQPLMFISLGKRKRDVLES